MAQATAATETSKVTPIGRKDKSGQEKVIDLGALRDKMQELVKLYNEAQEWKTNYSEAIKKVAEAAGLQSSVVRKYVAARAGDAFDEKKRDANQLSLVFEEV